MTYNPDKDPEIIAMRKSAAEAEVAAKAKADGFMKDDQLSRAKGKTPEQVEARKRVAALFCQFHLPHEKPELLKPRLEAIDYSMPVSTTNARGVDVEHPKGVGLLGFGRKPAYLVSQEYAPKSADAPVYALEYFPLHT